MTINFKIAALFLSLLPSIAYADFKDWDKEKKELFITYSVISTIDYLQTSSALNDSCRCYREANPLLGNYPNDEKLLGIAIITNYLVYRWFDSPNWSKKHYKVAQIATAVRLGVVAHNHSIGVGINLNF